MRYSPFIFSFYFFISSYFPLAAEVERLIPQVVAKLPHELPAFTQGLAIEEDQLYESTGLYGQSSLRQLDISTGRVIRKKEHSSNLFAEGIAVFPFHIFQITWREQRAFLYDRHTFKVQKVFAYSGEGWGLCRDGQTLWMSNGTACLVQRDIKTFAVLRCVDVHNGLTLINGLNDLECVGNALYANVYSTNLIVQIDKQTGELTGVIDASCLLTSKEKESLDASNVLNGIAYRPQTATFFITGKEWPWIFESSTKGVKMKQWIDSLSCSDLHDKPIHLGIFSHF